MAKAAAEAEVAVEGVETGEEVEVAVAVMGGTKVGAEVDRWVEVVVVVEVPLVAAAVDVAGVTLVSGKRTFAPFMILASRRKGTGWSPGSTPPKTTRPSTLFVRFSNLT